jgi:hypothetical protein
VASGSSNNSSAGMEVSKKHLTKVTSQQEFDFLDRQVNGFLSLTYVVSVTEEIAAGTRAMSHERVIKCGHYKGYLAFLFGWAGAFLSHCLPTCIQPCHVVCTKEKRQLDG